MRSHSARALILTAVIVGSLLTVAAPAAASSHSAAVTFDEQTSGGYTVTVDSVTLPDGGFVTIHDDTITEGNTLGSVVGSSAYLEEGTHENVTVRLEKPLSETGTLIAMPHTDSDGDHTYEFVSGNGGVDGPYTDGGNAVTDDASVTVSATVSMSDQPTDGMSVVVDRVELSEGGFIAVHNDSLLDGEVTGSIVGNSTYLNAGVHENVRIELDESVGNETVIPMPHMDTNGDEMYTFAESGGSEDGPFLNDEDGAVIDTAMLTAGGPAMISAMNATTGGHHVPVDSVFLPDGGFVTIHDGTVTEGETFESIRGTSTYLEAGLHRNVMVALDNPFNESATAVPMAHRDTDGDETYTFPESNGEADGPYAANGSAVVDTAQQTVAASANYNVQESAGHTITVDSADLSEGGFLAIHDASLGAGDALGSVVGHSEYLDAGHHEDVTVTLDAPLRASQSIVVMPHMDTNGDGMYTFVESDGSEDGPYVANGAPVTDAAKTIIPATVTADDQTTDGETVTVASVTLSNGGFVTIHDDTLLDGAVFDSVRGTSEYLGPGTHENVTVTLDSPLSEAATIHAMAHMDSDGDETYTFVESEGETDGPYVAAGAPVMNDAAVTVESVGDGTTDGTTTTTTDGMTTTTTDGMTTTTTDEMTTTTSESGGTPGFGVGAALVALLAAAALLARRR